MKGGEKRELGTKAQRQGEGRREQGGGQGPLAQEGIPSYATADGAGLSI